MESDEIDNAQVRLFTCMKPLPLGNPNPHTSPPLNKKIGSFVTGGISSSPQTSLVYYALFKYC